MSVMTPPGKEQAQAKPNPDGQPLEAKVRGESLFDRVSSFLMAIVVGAFIIVGWLSLVYFTNQAYATRVAAPLEIVEVFGGGGGTPDGTPGSTEKIDVPGADVAAQASNNEEEVTGDFEEPSVQETPAAMLDAVAEAGENMAEVDIAAVMPHGGTLATGRKASKIGTGGPGLGNGPGDGGVPREQRWSIVYNPGQTLQEYAQQLDALNVEFAIITGPQQLTYVSNFAQATPTKRFGSGQGDDRLYFIWAGGARKQSDIALLRKAGLEPADVVIQFYPKAVEEQLAQLERRYKGRQASEIRHTRFSVVPSGSGYTFSVLSQVPLR
jgi:hypothetical protein